MKRSSSSFTWSRARLLHTAVTHRGMTLMEVVIALGVVAFVVPIILAATLSSGDSRRASEADTRSVWIARQVQRELILNWAGTGKGSVIKTSLHFPEFSKETDPTVLAYDDSGEFLEMASSTDLEKSSRIAKASHLVAIYGEPYVPPNLSSSNNLLSLVRMRVIHPAKGAPSSRTESRYQFITPRQGTL